MNCVPYQRMFNEINSSNNLIKIHLLFHVNLFICIGLYLTHLFVVNDLVS